MKEISLNNGGVALIDDDDHERIARYGWRLNIYGYVTRSARKDGEGRKKTSIMMHREIIGLMKGDPRVVDHINGIKTDNRKSNLRICSEIQNLRNKSLTRQNTSGLKGASWSKRDKCWVASIYTNGKRKHLGNFKAAQEAHAAYCKAALELHGEFANFGFGSVLVDNEITETRLLLPR